MGSAGVVGRLKLSEPIAHQFAEMERKYAQGAEKHAVESRPAKFKPPAPDRQDGERERGAEGEEKHQRATGTWEEWAGSI